MKTRIKDVIRYLESIAPPVYQESYDNAGLIVGDSGAEVTGIVICLDSTEAVVDEAAQSGCNLIIAHHPIIFRGLKRLNGSNYVERTVMQAIRHDIAIYAIHTNLDNVYHKGVNARIADRLGLQNTRILAPKCELNTNADFERSEAANVHPEIGSGMIGTLPEAMDELSFLTMVKKVMKAGCVRHTRLLGREVRTVSVCGGSGSFLLPQAIGQGADVFLTADYKYHEYFDADGHLVIADIGHYESEQFTIDLLHEALSENFSTFALHFTKINTNPVFYL